MPANSKLEALPSVLLCALVASVCAFAATRSDAGESAGNSALGEGIPELYVRVAPAIVGLTCTKGPLFYFGTGTILDSRGIAVTSTTVVPSEARDIRVYLRGARVLPGRLVFADEREELAVVRIEGAPGERFPFVEVGDSESLRLGDLALTLGNSFRSIENDDQVSLGVGIVSGFYELGETLSQSKYQGPAIEITAPLNSGADGGALIDARGRFVGVLCLNYSKSRWLGTAVPVARLLPFLREHVWTFDDASEPLPTFVGLRCTWEPGGKVTVSLAAEGGPAERGGLAPGDLLEELGGRELRSLEDARAALEGAKPGSPLRVKALRGGQPLELAIEPWGRF